MFVALLTVVCLCKAVSGIFTPELDDVSQQIAEIHSHYTSQINQLQQKVSALQQALGRSQEQVKAIDERLPSHFAGEEGVTAVLQRQYTVDNNRPIPFDDVIVIVSGTTYNGTSGQFTCTTGGYYWVSANIYLISTTVTLTPEIVMNFEEQTASYAYQIGTSTGVTVSASALVNCPANQQIWVRTAENAQVIGTPINRSSSLSIVKIA